MSEDVKKQGENEKRKLKRKHRNDLILTAVMVLAAAVGLLVYNVTKEKGGYVAVIQGGEETHRFSLEEDQEFLIELENGEYNLLCIKAGKAYMKNADCPDQICVNHQPISNVGETIVCLPHEVVIKVIAGGSSQEIDMVI